MIKAQTMIKAHKLENKYQQTRHRDRNISQKVLPALGQINKAVKPKKNIPEAQLLREFKNCCDGM